jgi:hypothetical protein
MVGDTLSRISIVNDGGRDDGYGDYKVVVNIGGEFKALRVTDHRREDGHIALLKRIFELL